MYIDLGAKKLACLISAAATIDIDSTLLRNHVRGGIDACCVANPSFNCFRIVARAKRFISLENLVQTAYSHAFCGQNVCLLRGRA
jgi:hypothetical protein